MSIAANETHESHWLRLIRDGEILPEERISPLIEENESIKRILTSIVKSAGE
jgi:hypothetical protein